VTLALGGSILADVGSCPAHSVDTVLAVAVCHRPTAFLELHCALEFSIHVSEIFIEESTPWH